MKSRDVYIAKMKLQLDELNAAMGALEAEARQENEDARAKYREEIGKLREQSQLAIDKLGELKAAGEDSWENLVAGTERVRDALVHAFHDFRARL